MSRFLVVSTLLLACGLLYVGPAHADFDAAGYYQLRCASCHGASGEGTENSVPQLAPALKGNPLVVNAPVPAIAQIIRQGRSGQRRIYDGPFPNMPAFGPEAVPDVAARVNSLKGPLQQQ